MPPTPSSRASLDHPSTPASESDPNAILVIFLLGGGVFLLKPMDGQFQLRLFVRKVFDLHTHRRSLGYFNTGGDQLGGCLDQLDLDLVRSAFAVAEPLADLRDRCAALIEPIPVGVSRLERGFLLARAYT